MENDLLKNSISTIIQNIEVWDNKLSYMFSDCLGKLIDNIMVKLSNNIENSSFSISNFHNCLINMILNFFINIIENNDTDMTMHYTKGFNNIIETLSKYKKIIVENEIIEKVSMMGSFGKKNNLRKYSLFFCICLIRVKNIFNNFFIVFLLKIV